MVPSILAPEDIRRESGDSPPVEISRQASRSTAGNLVVTLGITRIVERQRLDVTIFGSDDGVHWEGAPLAAFRHKSFCGTYSAALSAPGAGGPRYLRAHWDMDRWGGQDRRPLFSFYILVDS